MPILTTEVEVTDLGGWIKHHRRLANLTQDQLAEQLLGADGNVVSDYERGKVQPRLDTMERFVAFFSLRLGKRDDLMWIEVGQIMRQQSRLPTVGEDVDKGRYPVFSRADTIIPLSPSGGTETFQAAGVQVG